MARKKKKSRRVLIAFTVLVLIFALAFFGYRWLEYRKAKYARYQAFGIHLPDRYSIHGIDVSRYQDIIAWEEVKNMFVENTRIGFAFMKATEGIGDTDPQFRRNWRKSHEAGLARGAYHFFLATKDGRKQAENFIRRVDLKSGDLPPVLDIEQSYGVSRNVLRAETLEWLRIVEEHYKVKPIIYTNVDFYERWLGEDFDEYPLWIAHYLQPEKPRIGRSWVFWQHSETGRVNGITTPVDFNVFNGDSLAFRKLLID